MSKKPIAAKSTHDPEKPMPMPSGGGVYIRRPDGTLQRQAEIPEVPETIEQPLKDD